MLDDALTAPSSDRTPDALPGTPWPAAGHVPDRVRTWAVPGVYGPAEDSRMLAEALRREDLRGARVLDLCTGSGFLAATAARQGADVAAVDVSRRAALAAWVNIRRNGGRGDVRRGDLLAAAPDGAYDVIVSNPPYVPAATDDLPTHGPARAWDGGRDGRAVLDRICREAPARLRPGGRILLVHSDVVGVERTLELLRDGGLHAEVVSRRRLTFGPVMQRRRALLTAERLIAEHDRSEELVVVRGRIPGDGGSHERR